MTFHLNSLRLGLTLPLLLLLGSGFLLNVQGETNFQPQAAEDSEFNVVATTSLLADFSSNLLGEEIESIIPPGVCPSHFDPTTSEVAKLAEADLVLCHGFEGWLDDLLEGAENIEAKRVIGPLVGGLTWNVPTNAISRYIPALTTIFSEEYPTFNATFEDNADAYIAEIEESMDDIKNNFDSSPNADAKVAVMDHQQYFAEWLGLEVAVVWNASDEAMSAQDIVTVVEIAEEQNVTIFISNNPSGTLVGADMAVEIGASHVVMANFPGDEGTTDYISMITQNAARIGEAKVDEGKNIPGYPTLIIFSISGVAILIFIHKRKRSEHKARS